ncbi:MAG: hypothetical protein CVU05_11270 [Bacteroidetes bacterium HGW-Bacteroidetes-21]|nr:MAG: hypothetical protein CVU05_11270 [Bacteroidetes bacterium HGW-Bacteroidetes-21]
MIVRKNNWSGKPYWDMYIADIEKGQLTNPKNFNKDFNGKFHDGPASFSNKGNYIAYTRNNYDNKRKDKVVELQICFSTYKNDKWSDPEMFYLNNQDYSVGQPSLTEDGNTMYFASDMAGGFGGADLYKVTRVGTGAWGNLVNLGNKINTEGDEMFPNIDEKTNTLYFASNGHFGLGGLDIFSSKVFESGYDKVYNAGYPLNTQYDDFAAVINDSLNEGFFTSNRVEGKGGDDIYAFDLLEVMDSPLADVVFSVNAPLNIPAKRVVRETFPIRNYIFFTLGSTEIPDRYVLLKKDQVKEFKETNLEVFAPKKLSGRSARQMTAYYNIMNILGDRMGKNPGANITLIGSSEKGPEDGKLMAESVKKYLVDIFGISPTRIAIEGRDKPKLPSEKIGFTKELDLLRECDQRVTIESSSPALLMEFRSGQDAPLKPVEIVAVEEAPLDSYVSFCVDGGKDTLSSWSLSIKDSAGVTQKFGPYVLERIFLSGKSILGTRAQGDYTVTMTGQTTTGLEVIKDTTVHMVLWVPSEKEEGMRFSVIYEFNSSDAIKIYEKYLSEVVVPKIPIDSKVYIAGYTDVVGIESHNLKLSMARANDVKDIMKTALSKAGRTDVTFKVDGYGEDTNHSPFENGLPEERFYNRTVVIEVVPKN